MFNSFKFNPSSFVLWVCVSFFMFFGWSQSDFANLRKNINYRAKVLNHFLNTSKDTLVINSSQRIYRLYSVGNASNRIDEHINDFEYKLPLRSLKKGKYLLVAQLHGLKIVFELRILQRQPYTQDLVASIGSKSLLTQNYDLKKAACLEVFNKATTFLIKPYNVTDLDRTKVQSREECRRLMAIQREKLRAEIISKRKASRGKRNFVMN